MFPFVSKYFVPNLSALINFQLVMLVTCAETHVGLHIRSLFLLAMIPHSGDNEKHCLLGCKAVWSGTSLQTFRRKAERSAWCSIVFLVKYSTMQKEEEHLSETLKDVYYATWRQIPEDRSPMVAPITWNVDVMSRSA